MAPISGTISGLCKDDYGSFFALGDLRIIHMASANFNYTNGSNVKQGQEIGKLYEGKIPDKKKSGRGCGYSSATHIHIRFTKKDMVIDGTKLSYNTNYYSKRFVSTNGVVTPQTPALTPSNPFTGQIRLANNNNLWTFDVRNFGEKNGSENNFNQTPVSMVDVTGRNLNNAQKFNFDKNTSQIKSITDSNGRQYCLDSGDQNRNNEQLRIEICHEGLNQKWYFDINNRLINQAKDRCLMWDSQISPQAWKLFVKNCNELGEDRKIWTLKDMSWYPVFVFERQGTNFCVSHGDKVKLAKCDTNNDDQKWQDLGNGVLRRFKRIGGNYYCLNAYGPKNMSVLNSYKCSDGDPDQKWTFVNSRLERTQAVGGKKYSLNMPKPAIGSSVTMYQSNVKDGDQKLNKNIIK